MTGLPPEQDHQFFTAMRDMIRETPMPDAAPAESPWRRALAWSQDRRSRLVVSCAAVLAVATVGVVVFVLGSPTTPPAYAITRNHDGSFTVTLNDLTHGIPALNAKLNQLRIPETVIPIRTDCHPQAGADDTTLSPSPLYEFKNSVLRFRTGRSNPPPKGFRYVLAARRLPNGKILALIGAIKPPLPSCIRYTPGQSS
jgi:hypothetical protein